MEKHFSRQTPFYNYLSTAKEELAEPFSIKKGIIVGFIIIVQEKSKLIGVQSTTLVSLLTITLFKR